MEPVLNARGEPLMISCTELQDAMRCRLQWDWISPNRQALERRGTPPIYLHTGTAWHYALAAAVDGKDPVAELEKWCVQEEVRLQQEYLQRVGSHMSTSEQTVLKDSHAMAQGMARLYFDRYSSNPIAPLEYIASELSWRIPIETAFGIVYLVGTLDGVALNPASGGIWIVEHKTYGQKPDTKWLQYDHQQTGYAWAAQTLLNCKVEGVLYDGQMKKLPKEPRKLKDGTLSKEWTDYTFESYVRSLRAHYAIPDDVELIHDFLINDAGTTVSQHYGEFLNRLKIRDGEDQTPFFTRKKVYPSQHQIRLWGRDMTRLVNELSDPDVPIYPNRAWSGCWDCWVSELCDAYQGGADLDRIISRDYEVSGFRPQYKSMLELTPENVSSIDDLRALAGAE